MGFLDNLSDFLDYTPIAWISSAAEAGLDSLGLSQHGRDQYFNRDMQQSFLNQQQDFQREMTANQQNFTREMYNQQWQDMLSKYPQLAQILNNQQFNLWRQQFNMQNAWNESMYQKYQSPQAVATNNAAAGLNPASLNGVNNGVAASSMGGSSAQMPPQISPTPFQSHASPLGLPQGLSSRGDTLAQVGNFLKDVSEMQLNQKKIGRYDEQMDAQIKEALASAGLQEQKSKYQQIVNDVDSFMLPHKTASEVKLNLALAAKYAAEENESQANARLDDALTELNKTKNDEAKSRLPFVEMEVRSQIDDIRASAQEKRAAAAEARQRTETERFNTRIAEIRADIDSSTKPAKITSLINELRAKNQISKENYKEAKVRLDRLRVLDRSRQKDAFFRGVDGMLDWLSTKIGIAFNGSVSSSSSSSVSDTTVHK